MAEEKLQGSDRAEYGVTIVKNLADHLTEKYGGYGKRNLYEYLRFYRAYSDFVHLGNAQSSVSAGVPIVHLGSAQLQTLSWSHYRTLMQVPDEKARKWYEDETRKSGWNVKTLKRNISTQYYYRILQSSDPSVVEREMKELMSPYQDKLEFIKSPYIVEFLGMQEKRAYHESDLETNRNAGFRSAGYCIILAFPYRDIMPG
ncbi:MAG: DUF1016 N-terminal domain-containing protein [Eubacterium sp.]